ncbi:MAG: hypothetical protein ACTSU0_07100 [Alphaproteobacteria bacterium]
MELNFAFFTFGKMTEKVDSYPEIVNGNTDAPQQLAKRRIVMGKINIGRWIVGGVVAAIILFVTDGVLNGVILDQQFEDAMTALGMPAMSEDFAVGTFAVFAALDLIVGLTAVGIYVGIRPRFGAGATTAVYAGLATWLLVGLVADVSLMAVNLLPAGLLWTSIIVGVIQIPVATVAGAYLYKENA